MSSTYAKGYADEGFIKENFGVLGFHNDENFDLNLISRIRNVLVSALNQQDMAPKLIIFTLDDDMIKFLDYEKYGASIALGKIMDSLIENINDILKCRKEQLPKKATQNTHVIWIGAPLHQDFSDIENTLRVKLNACMESIIKQFPNMSFLQPRKGWLVDNHRMMKNDSYTVEGARIYWRAVDAAIKFWLFKKNNQQVIQKGAQLGSLEGNGRRFNEENIDETCTRKVQSKVVKLQHDSNGGMMAFGITSSENCDTNHNNKFARLNDNNGRSRFDRYHWYRNSSDMERGHGELRRKQATPKKFRRKLNF